MPRPPTNVTIEQIVYDAVASAVARATSHINRAINQAVKDQLRGAMARRSGSRRSGTTGSRARGEITRWVADKRARRVPTFVIEATGLDTKKKIVAKYGEAAAFERGKPLPAARAGEATSASRVVKAKPPTIRKGGKRIVMARRL